MSDIIKLYNPANAASLTPDEIQGLQNLNSDEIKQLAKAYPNSAFNKNYLLIIDGTKPSNKQLPTLSTFENLWNLRERSGQRNYVPFNFKGVYQPRTIAHVSAKKTEVLDLSETELLSLPGFKTKSENGTEKAAQTVAVKKVRKTKI